jgi:ADP-ribose pyrophosphatase
MNWTYLGSSKETDHRFLNFYVMHYKVEKKGAKTPYSYFLASRNEKENDLRAATKEYARPDAVLIGAYLLDDSGIHFLLEKQFRPSLNRYVYAFPAGLVDKEDKDEFETAYRETKEETGFEIEDITRILPPSPTSEGLSDECNAVVSCRLKRKGESKKEDFEDISSRLYSEDEVYSLLSDSGVMFSNSARLLLLLLLERYGKRTPKTAF